MNLKTSIAIAMLLIPSLCAKENPIQVISEIKTHAVQNIQLEASHKSPQNIIILVGDGMGAEHMGAAWMVNKGALYMTQLPVAAHVNTLNSEGQITDSAAASTAFATGEKTRNGRIGMNAQGDKLSSIATHARKRGMKTGLVVTKPITDATPAGFYASVLKRGDTKSIASQLLHAEMSVLIGSGRRDFTPDQLDELEKNTPVLKWLADGNAPYASLRDSVLEESAASALDYLGQNSPDGFFLMIEGSHIDLAGHANDGKVSVEETLDFDRTVGVVMKWAAQHPNTLVLVFADHSTGGLSLVGGSAQTGTAKVRFSTGNHNGAFIPLMAGGAGSLLFAGTMENTDIFTRLAQLISAREADL